MSLMSRPPGEPRNWPTAGAEPLPEVISGESCDRCGAVARHHVYVPFSHGRHGKRELGELYFCRHHYDRALPALIARGMVLG